MSGLSLLSVCPEYFARLFSSRLNDSSHWDVLPTNLCVLQTFYVCYKLVIPVQLRDQMKCTLSIRGYVNVSNWIVQCEVLPSRASKHSLSC